MPVVGLGQQKQARISAEDVGPLPGLPAAVAHSHSPDPNGTELGLRMGISSTQENVISALLLQHGWLVLPPKRKVVGFGGVGRCPGGGRLTIDIAQSRMA